ncbi:MAG TPA: hypothetical protein QGF58_06270 [Myxococcota bacterium]|nr:hypothetical protein [Myxococcota bacterium]
MLLLDFRLEGGEIVSRFRADMAGTLDDESATMSLADLVDCGLVVEDDDETYSLVIEPGSELKLELGELFLVTRLAGR